MTRPKRRQTMLSTTVSVFLSMTVHISEDDRKNLFIIPLFPLTAWLLWWWRLKGVVNQVKRAVTGQFEAGCRRLLVWLTFTQIGLRAALYGAGVNV